MVPMVGWRVVTIIQPKTRPKRAVSVATDLHSSTTQDSSESSTAVAASDLAQNAARHVDQPWDPAGTGTSKRKRESEFFFFSKINVLSFFLT